MKARRLTIDTVPDGTRVVLDERLAHYAGRVLRLPAGAPIDLVDASGARWRGVLRFDGSTALVVDLVQAADAETPEPLVVVAALLKQSAWEWMLEKATELGATSIIPFAAERSVVRLDDDRAAAKRERWQRICDSAVRQSERAHRVEVLTPRTLTDALDALAPPNHRLVHFDETCPETPWPGTGLDGPVALVTGPEGGFTDAERALLASRGAVAVGLGPSLLKAETATIAGLSALRLLRGELLP